MPDEHDDAMDEPTAGRWSISGLITLALALAATAGAIWWFFTRASVWPAGAAPLVGIAVLTALSCAAMIAWAIRRAGAAQAARLRARADAYEALLELVMRPGPKRITSVEWSRVNVRLLLWGSDRVMQEYLELQTHPSLLAMKRPINGAAVAALLGAMRADLGQPRLEIGTWEPQDENSPDE